MEDRRIKLVPINAQALLSGFFLDGHKFEVTKGLPKDARVVGAGIVPDHLALDLGSALIVVESQSFDLVPAGHPIPHHAPIEARTIFCQCPTDTDDIKIKPIELPFHSKEKSE